MGRITIGSNISALSVQRKLDNTTSVLRKTFEALSSGMRINRASDDAAGLAVSESLNADSRVFSQGARNLNDGQSLLSIADGALTELTGIVTRIKELSEQSANGVYSTKQRYALDAEAQALAKEYNRIARTTEFNGRKLFDSNFGQLGIQAGYGLDGSVLSNLGGGIGDGTFGSEASSNTVAAAFAQGLASGDFNGDGITDLIGGDYFNGTARTLLGNGDGTFTTGGTTSFGGAGSGINDIEVGDFNNDGIQDLVASTRNHNGFRVSLGIGNGTFSASTFYASGTNNDEVKIADFNGDGIQDIASFGSGAGININLGNGDGTFRTGTSIGGTNYSIATGDFNNDGKVDITSGQAVYLGRGDGTFNTGVALSGSTTASASAVADFNGDGIQDIIATANTVDQLRLYIGIGNGTFNASTIYSGGDDNNALAVGDFNGDGNIDVVTNDAGVGYTLLTGKGDGTLNSAIDITSSVATTNLITTDLNNDGVLDLAGLGATTARDILGTKLNGVSALQSFSLRSQYDSKQSLTYMSQVLTRISQQRGQIGSFQARLTIASNNLSATNENYQIARSRIIDADIAEETSKMVRANILQQAGSSILGQANTQPRIALKLLEDI